MNFDELIKGMSELEFSEAFKKMEQENKKRNIERKRAKKEELSNLLSKAMDIIFTEHFKVYVMTDYNEYLVDSYFSIEEE